MEIAAQALERWLLFPTRKAELGETMVGVIAQVRFLCFLNRFDFQSCSMQHFRKLLLENNLSSFQCPCSDFSTEVVLMWNFRED